MKEEDKIVFRFGPSTSPNVFTLNQTVIRIVLIDDILLEVNILPNYFSNHYQEVISDSLLTENPH